MGKSTSYSDVLRLYTSALRLLEKAGLSEASGRIDHAFKTLLEATANIIKALLLYHGRKPLGIKDPLYLASIALDEGLIDRSEFSILVKAVTSRSRIESIALLKEFIGIIRGRLGSLDPYLDEQLKLYRY